MPKSSVQRSFNRPTDTRTIGVSSVVFEFKSWACGVEARKSLDVGVEGIGFVDVPVACVDCVATEGGVDVGEGSYAGTYPCGRQGVGGGLIGAVVGIPYICKVLVCVSEEDVGDDMR